MKLLVATGNKHKLREIREIFAGSSVDILGLEDVAPMPEVVEDRETFRGNALKKAEETAALTGLWTLADDSGLEVDALDGQPGVYSARYAGEPVDNKANNRKLLRELAGVTQRTARFRCAVALVSPTESIGVVEGTCEGHIIDTPRGIEGFGYDPLFVPKGHDKTFAQMKSDQKNAISHRANALARARTEWGSLLLDQG